MLEHEANGSDASITSDSRFMPRLPVAGQEGIPPSAADENNHRTHGKRPAGPRGYGSRERDRARSGTPDTTQRFASASKGAT